MSKIFKTIWKNEFFFILFKTIETVSIKDTYMQYCIIFDKKW